MPGCRAEALAGFQRLIQTGPSNYVAQQQKLQEASANVMWAFLNNRQPLHSMAFASAALKMPYFGQGRQPSFDLPRDLPAIESTTLHYRILLESTCALRCIGSTRRVLADFKERALEVDTQIYRGLARLVFSTVDGDAARVVKSLRAILPDYSRKGLTRTEGIARARLTTLATTLQEMGFVDKAILASSRERWERGDEPQELLEWLTRDTSVLFEGSIEEALAVSAEPTPTELGRKMTPEAYAMRIRVYAVVRRDYEAAQAVYMAMLAHGVRPTMKHIGPLVEGLIGLGRIAEAQQLKVDAQELLGVPAPMAMHRQFIWAYMRTGDHALARRELEELETNGYAVDEHTANVVEAGGVQLNAEVPLLQVHNVATRFGMLMARREYVGAMQLVAEALDAGIEPDSVLHDLVRRGVGYVKRRDAEALALGEEVKKRVTLAVKEARGRRERCSRAWRVAVTDTILEWSSS